MLRVCMSERTARRITAVQRIIIIIIIIGVEPRKSAVRRPVLPTSCCYGLRGNRHAAQAA
jgi:hypothetical protein